MNCFTKCLPIRQQKYTILSNNDKTSFDKFNILECKYCERNKKKHTKNESYVIIESDSIKLKSDCVKFEYISHWKIISYTKLILYIFGTIDENKTIIFSDNFSAILLRFTSNNSLLNFQSHMVEMIQEYKKIGTYDKSILQYKNYNYFKLYFNEFK